MFIGSSLLAVASELTSIVIGVIAVVALVIDNQPEGILVGIACLITLVVFCVFTICKGLVAALETIFWAMTLIVTVYAAAALVIAVAMVVTAAGPSAVAQAWTQVGTVGKTVVTVGVIALQLAIVVVLWAGGLLAVAIAWTNGGAKRTTVVPVTATPRDVVGIALVGIAVGIALVVLPLLLSPIEKFVVLALVGAVTGIVARARLSDYVCWRFLAGDAKHAFVWKVAIALAAIGSTKFRGADLTDADFTKSTLENTDFRRAILTRCCWFQSKQFFSTRF